MAALRSLALHRANDLALAKLPSGFCGAEIDLRTESKQVILAHDPFIGGPKFADWLELFSGTFLILNVKEVGIEASIVQDISNKRPDLDYFFLDLPTPSLLKAISEGLPAAARVSEFENVVDAQNSRASWIWIDSFTGDWTVLEKLLSVSQKTCLVSPELQGRSFEHHRDEFERIKSFLNHKSDLVDLICTKNETFWYV